MSDWNGFRGAAKRIDDVDLPRIGARIGVGEDELHAFMDVETAGSGFDKEGRPKMLFEPHKFYRHLAGEKRSEAVAAGLAYPKQGTKPYPKDSYPRLVAAMQIDEQAALKSASWGLGQILGENHKLAGYDSVEAMVRAFMADEEAHLEAMVNFIIETGIDDDLREHRWDMVARVYNGKGYARHDYHGRMARAFAKWKRIRDTAWSPESEAEAADRIQAAADAVTAELPPAPPSSEPPQMLGSRAGPPPRPIAGMVESAAGFARRVAQPIVIQSPPAAPAPAAKPKLPIWKFVAAAVGGGALFGAANTAGLDLGRLWDGVEPFLLEAIGAVVLVIIGWVATYVKSKFGIDIEAKHREALHSAIVTGLNLAVMKAGDRLDGRTLALPSNPIAAEAMRWVSQSTPDALAYFGIQPGTLHDMILAKAPQVLGMTAPVVAPPR